MPKKLRSFADSELRPQPDSRMAWARVTELGTRVRRALPRRYWPVTLQVTVTFCLFLSVRVWVNQLAAPLRAVRVPVARTEMTAASAGAVATARVVVVAASASAGARTYCLRLRSI